MVHTRRYTSPKSRARTGEKTQMTRRRVIVSGQEGSREWWRSVAADAARQRRAEQRDEFGWLLLSVTWKLIRAVFMLLFLAVIGYPI